MSDFITRGDDTLERITSSAPAVGFDKVMYPGQMEEEKRRKWGAEGIPFADDVWERFAEAARKVGVEV